MPSTPCALGAGWTLRSRLPTKLDAQWPGDDAHLYLRGEAQEGDQRADWHSIPQGGHEMQHRFAADGGNVLGDLVKRGGGIAAQLKSSPARSPSPQPAVARLLPEVLARVTYGVPTPGGISIEGSRNRKRPRAPPSAAKNAESLRAFPCYCVGVSETPGFVSYRVIVYEALNVWDFSTAQVVTELKRRAQVLLTDEMATEMIKAQQRHEKQTYEDWLAFASRPKKPNKDEDILFLSVAVPCPPIAVATCNYGYIYGCEPECRHDQDHARNPCPHR